MSVREVRVPSVTGEPVIVDIVQAAGQEFVRICITHPGENPGMGRTSPPTLVYTSVERAEWLKLRDVGQPFPPGREQQILAAAKEIAQHWHDQEGVNAALIDKLADLVLG